jgi:isocitrate dehydrogenase
MWAAHLEGAETSLNPLGMVEALIGAMQHSARLAAHDEGDNDKIIEFANNLRHEIHTAMATGKGTRDLCGPSGLTTEAFVNHIGAQLATKYA